ncbi:hypothetical protein [Promicromonospora sukumoe]|uniref:Uncharacterized protein n=1 Tax=Promicromonospora sukumoe TaxID=88382 RepID=A0A7W3JE00_9MICO|nr:hypothetical protein [Promicromonospora sukumoe]MBA8811090.1 hypothetical protein [Promicromonospora sukumoe]
MDPVVVALFDEVQPKFGAGLIHSELIEEWLVLDADQLLVVGPFGQSPSFESIHQDSDLYL